MRDNRATNTFEIKEKGWAFGQIADMEKWVQSEVVQKAIKEAGGQLNVTGYSLGGHLATAFNILHRNENLIKSTYTFNGAGVGFAKDNVEMTQDKLRETMTYFNNIKNNESHSREHLLNHSVLISDDVGNRKEYSLKSIYENAQNLLSQSLISSNDEKGIALYHQNAKLLKESLFEILLDFTSSKNIHMSDAENVGFYNGLKYLHSAVNRISELLNEYNRLSNLSSGNGSNPNKVQASDIDALQLSYQIAVSATADKYTSALSFGGGVVNVIDDAAILDKREIRKAQEQSQIDNFYNVWAETKPSMVAVSQVHYGKNDVLVSIEDQPLVRGDYLSLVARETGKQAENLKDLADLQLLTPNYSNNDFGDTHSLVLIVDSLSVQHAMSILDKNFKTEQFDEIMAAITNKTGTSDGGQGKADGLALETITQALSKIVLNKEQDGLLDEKLLSGNTWHEIGGREKLHQTLFEIVGGEKKTNTDKYRITSLATMKADDVIQAAKQDSHEGLAYRYALKELNPFIVTHAEIPNAITAYDNETLKLYNSENNHNGMTETYIQQRAHMLAWKNAFGHANVSYDDLFNSVHLTTNVEEHLSAILGMLPPKNINGSWNYNDKATDVEFLITGENSNLFTKHYVRFGTSNADKLEGGDLQDYLFGGDGHDTFASSKGDDYMEGGKDHDVYHIKGNDTVFDSDMNGQIIFDGGDNPRLFIKTPTGKWAALGKDGKPSKTIIATQQDNDLLIQNKDDSVLIKDFFVLAKHIDGALWSGLGFNLIEKDIPNTYASEENTINSFQIRADSHVNVAIMGNERSDTVMPFTGNSVVVDAGEGKDILYGNGKGNNILLGGKDNDLLHGANYGIRNKEKDVLADVIVGGEGHDLIDGMGGKDIIHTGEIDEYLDKTSSNQKGDWAVGHLGNDDIYGSRGHDFLQGGSGIDTIYGGAGNDVILGDGDVLFETKWDYQGAISSSSVVTLMPNTVPVVSPTLTGLVPPIGTGVTPTITEIAGSKRGCCMKFQGVA